MVAEIFLSLTRDCIQKQWRNEHIITDHFFVRSLLTAFCFTIQSTLRWFPQLYIVSIRVKNMHKFAIVIALNIIYDRYTVLF